MGGSHGFRSTFRHLNSLLHRKQVQRVKSYYILKRYVVLTKSNEQSSIKKQNHLFSILDNTQNQAGACFKPKLGDGDIFCMKFKMTLIHLPPLSHLSLVPMVAPGNVHVNVVNSTLAEVHWDPVPLKSIRGHLQGYRASERDLSCSFLRNSPSANARGPLLGRRRP